MFLLVVFTLSCWVKWSALIGKGNALDFLEHLLWVGQQGKQGFAEKRCGQLPYKVLFTARFQLPIKFQALMEKVVCGELWQVLLDVSFLFLFF